MGSALQRPRRTLEAAKPTPSWPASPRRYPWAGRSTSAAEPAGNAIWLALQGWQPTAVDISANALARAEAHAVTAGVADRIDFERHDLARTFPSGAFELVSALYLQSPVRLPREQVLRKGAAAVATGGLLLIVEHASVAPWSWSNPETAFPTPQEALARLELDLGEWHTEFLGAPERMANGPGGQTAMVADNIIALKRLSP